MQQIEVVNGVAAAQAVEDERAGSRVFPSWTARCTRRAAGGHVLHLSAVLGQQGA